MHSLTTCRMAATAIPGNCQPATNQYTVSGTVSFSFIPAGTLTITDDGANTNVKSTTIQIAASATSTAYSLSGIISGGRLHTITFTFSNPACAPVSLTYLSPTSCTAVACTGTNLLLNPSFEQGFTVPPAAQQTQVPPPNWVGGTADNNPQSFAAPDGYAYGFSGDNGGTLCQFVSAAPGTTYKMTFYGGIHEVHGQAVTLSFLNGGTMLGNQQSFTQTHILESDNAFGGPYSLSGVAPTGTTQVRVCAVSANNAGYQYWSKIDNLCLTATPPPCSLAMTVTPGFCASATNSYVLSGTINATNVPTSGTLTISSGAFSTRTLTLPVGNASGTFSYSGLVSNGEVYTVTAAYSNAACAPVSKTFTAPISCSVAPVCSLTAAVTRSLCASATNTYSASVAVALTNGVAGTITVSIPGSAPISQTLAANTSSFIAVFAGLISDGASHTATISLPGCGTTIAIYTAPGSCSVAPVCSLSASVTKSSCASATNTYSVTAVVTVKNPVAGTLSVSTQGQTLPFSTTANSQNTFTVVFAGLISDGASHTIVASLPGCGTVNAAYTAPASCSVAPICSLSANVTKGFCASVTNAYSPTAVVMLTNPTAGTLTITDGPQSATFITTAASSATFTVTFADLVSDGSPHTLTASLPGCSTTSTTYTAPASCSVAPVCGLSVTANGNNCNPLTNRYVLSGTITLTNSPVSQTLTLTDGSYVRSLTANVGNTSLSFSYTTLQSDGATHIVTVTSSATACNSASTTYTAPISCSITPVCSLTVTPKPGLCQTATNGYSSTVVVGITNTGAGGKLTITDGPLSQSVTVGAGFNNFTATVIFNNLPSTGSTHTVSATLAGCSSASATYTAPASCSVTPIVSYGLTKTVDRSRAVKGGTVTYIITLTNTGNTPAANLVLTDQLSNTAVTFVGSVSVSSGTFTAGLNNGTWTLTSLALGEIATLAYKVQLNREGITYNTVTGPDGHTITVCTTVPYVVCANENFEFLLSTASGFNTYQWSRNGQPIAGATSTTYSATALGEYTVMANGQSGCANGSCCPYIIESYGPAPSLTAMTVSASCNGLMPLTDATITLVGSSTNAVNYNISMGNSFTASPPLFGSLQPLSGVVGGVLLANQPNPVIAPGASYTIRVYTAEGCYSDVVVVIPPALCQCPPAQCTPIVVKKTKTGGQ